MIKNFTRIRQWAGEKLGSSHGTLPSEEFKDFQLETKLRHEDFDEMRHTVSAAIKHIPLKKNSSGCGHRRSLIGDFGESLVTHASMFPSDSIYWKMLVALGRGERQLSEAEGDFANATKDNYMALLFEYDQHYKEYQSLCRKLESRRLDYDAKYNRLQKAKKESPESEQSVQAAKVKYEETELDVVQSMIYLQETEVDHCDGLLSLLDSQLDFHGKAFDILQNVKMKWDHWTENCSKTGFSPISTTPNQFSNRGSEFHDYDRVKPTLRRALYDHIQDLDDELTFHVNDIITVLRKVDDGWWLGELKDKNNLIYRGIFPVNYTEPYIDDTAVETNGQLEKSDKDSTDSTDNKRSPDLIGETTNNGTTFMESSACERDRDHPFGITADNKGGHDQDITQRRNEKAPNQKVRPISPTAAEIPLSSFVSPAVSSQVSRNDHHTRPQSKQSPSSSSISIIPESEDASSSQEEGKHGHDKAPITPSTHAHEKAPAALPPSLGLPTPADTYCRPLPPIPSDD